MTKKTYDFARFPKSFSNAQRAELLEGGAKILEREEWYQGAFHNGDCWSKPENVVALNAPWAGDGKQELTCMLYSYDHSRKGQHCAMGAMEIYAYEAGMWPDVTNLSAGQFERAFDGGAYSGKTDRIINKNDDGLTTKAEAIAFMREQAEEYRKAAE